MASLPGYIYGVDGNSMWVNLFQSSRMNTSIGSTGITIEQTTDYPWNGKVEVGVEPDSNRKFSVKVRIPAWTTGCTVAVNGEEIVGVRPGHYLSIDRNWEADSRISIEMDMPIRFVEAHPRAREDFGCAAIARGPVIYCVESVDNPGTEVQNYMLPRDTQTEFVFEPDLLGGVGVIKFDALEMDGNQPLYANINERKLVLNPVRATAIPYYAWANRGESSMLVWLPLTENR
jgi:DUF1680 family protein